MRYFRSTGWTVLVCLLAVLLILSPGAAADTPETQLWEAVKDSNDAAKIELYLKAYPQGVHAKAARMRLLLLKNPPRGPKRAPGKPIVIRPTPAEYLKYLAKRAELVPHGKLDLDGIRPSCLGRPTILDPDLDDYSASFPGFIILNPRLMGRVSRTIKLWIYSVGCGFQHHGDDIVAADCFAVRQGRRDGWLSAKGMDEVCGFMQPAEAGNRGPRYQSGTARCQYMKQCFSEPEGK